MEYTDHASRRTFWGFAALDLEVSSSISGFEDVQLALRSERQRLLNAIGPFRAARVANHLVFTGLRCLWCLFTSSNANSSEMVHCKYCHVATYCSEEHRRKATVSHVEVQTTMGKTEVWCCSSPGCMPIADCIYSVITSC